MHSAAHRFLILFAVIFVLSCREGADRTADLGFVGDLETIRAGASCSLYRAGSITAEIVSGVPKAAWVFQHEAVGAGKRAVYAKINVDGKDRTVEATVVKGQVPHLWTLAFSASKGDRISSEYRSGALRVSIDVQVVDKGGELAELTGTLTFSKGNREEAIKVEGGCGA